ncbi:MAG: AraC family transcriptional regulator [Hydrogenophaga sp.]|uniref:AraC family transcriptional regulator n=1 Tax=Hydrogenophaga sp. TaxID=1904254 RepID=UPI002610A75B|nr:AraC family transcriptional regulator [Hydrogenophaga sp.]MCW5668683.1 AraC family transcriptional regulator [Hydrogenophaga sp.]
MATISSYYFRECIKGAARKGVDTDKLLAAADVPKSLLEDPYARGDVDAMAHLVQQLWYSMDDEFMGFTENRAKVGLFGLMTRFIVPCESLGQVLQAGVRFYNLTRTDVFLGLSHHGDEARFETKFSRPDLDPNHYFLEFWMVIWHRLAGWITGGPLPLRWASFTFSSPLEYQEEFKYLFPCEQRFEQAINGFAFDEKYLRLPVVRSKAELKAMLKAAPLMFMTMPSSDLGIARRVRATMVPRQGQAVDFPSIETVAAALHTTPQTLRRKLNREGSSYGEIKENIRRDIAIQRVLKGNARIEDIAQAVGYAETRSFTRAFHQWTGYSPLQYRQRFQQSAGRHDMLS